MTTPLERYRQAQDRDEAARTAVARAQGAGEQLARRLKDEFNVNSIKEGKALLAKLEREGTELDKELAAMEKAFAERWSQVIEGGR